MKRAFITGIEGQDGSYLAELLLAKGYEVHGIFRRSSNGKAANLKHLSGEKLFLYPAELDDADSVRVPLEKSAPDELYHLASQSHVGQSFEAVEETCRVTGMGALRLLEMARHLSKPPRFFHASSSEIFGSPEQSPQDENTPVNPVTPYGCAKAFGTQMTRVYRKNFGLFAVNGILFNHESPRRGENFVTRKICRAVAAIKHGRQQGLALGDTSAQRDWGNARDYVRGMWLALQHETPEDFVFATGKMHRVQDIVEIAFQAAGLDWREHVQQEKALFRPADPRQVVGNPAKAKRFLGWEPEITFEATIREMVAAELGG
ncbi:MAG TPA: GDP-mannose 4,6-dehydratase [Verrucomicrobiae bacterium]|nr:GDP-mannose 4,6-dehydratase [Verrucomicrobiae bacterium]